MHGRAGEERERGRHMWKGPTRSNSVVAGDVSSSSSSFFPANSFCKVFFLSCTLLSPFPFAGVAFSFDFKFD